MSNIDSLEPFYLAASLTLVFPSIIFAIYVYYQIFKSKKYSKSRYLRLYTYKALNEVVAFFMHLFCLHLPIQNFMFPLLKQITHSLVLPIFGFILFVSLLASLLYGIFLSLNRYLAIARVTLFRKYNDHYVPLAIVLIYPLPILFGMRALIWQPYFIEYKGRAGPIFLFFTPDMNGLADAYQYCITAFYLTCSSVEFAVNGITLYFFARKNVFEGSITKRRVELGLFITTLCSFALTLMITIAQVCIQFFAFTSASMYAMWGEQIVVDVMAMSSVYFLLAFSTALRRDVLGCSSRVSSVEAYNKPTASAHLSP